MPLLRRFPLLLGFTLFALPACAEDSFDAVMARMKPQSAVSIRYEEIRYLELLDKPWHGSGYLYALPPDLMIKEQWRPSREIMGADGKHLYYYDRDGNVRHHSEMRADDPAAAHVEAFRALLNGNRESIDKLYNVEFDTKPQRWQIKLTAKTPEVAAVLEKITVSGLTGQPADKLEIRQTGGDRSELSLHPEPGGAHLRSQIELLYKDLQSGN